MDLRQVLAGAAVLLPIEGLAHALAPPGMRRAIAALASMSPARPRAGLPLVAALGRCSAWCLVRG